MFDIGIGFSEMMLLAVIVIIVVGPEELPSLLRSIGRYVGQIKRVADDFRSQVDEAIKEPVGDIQESIEGIGDDLDDDPFGEQDLIDFEEHNKKILDQEKEQHKNETATQKALREGGMKGLDSPKKSDGPKDEGAKAVAASAGSGKEQQIRDSDMVLAKKNGT